MHKGDDFLNENEKKEFNKIAKLQPLVIVFGLVAAVTMGYLYRGSTYMVGIAVAFGISAAAGFQYVILREVRLLLRSVAVRHIDSNFRSLASSIYSRLPDKSLSIELKKPSNFSRYYAFCFTEEPGDEKIEILRKTMETYVRQEKYIHGLDGFVVSVMGPELSRTQRDKLLRREYRRMKRASMNPFRKRGKV